MSKFEKFFANSNTLLVFFILAIICFGATLGYSAFLPGLDIITTVAVIIMLIVLYASFNGNWPNVMHTMTGSILVIFVYQNILKIAETIRLFVSAPPALPGDALEKAGQLVQNSDIPAPETNPLMLAMPIIAAALFVILFFNHLSINSFHHSTKGRILLNQIIALVLVGYQVAVIIIAALTSPDAEFVISKTVQSLGIIFIADIIVCIETKLNAYKLIREASAEDGSWTEKKKAKTKKDLFHIDTDVETDDKQ